MAKIIKKKILPCYFTDVCIGSKTFELRKDEDNIQVGDTIILLEYAENFTGSYVTKEVTYVLRDCPQYGLMEGYCIIGLGDTLNYN